MGLIFNKYIYICMCVFTYIFHIHHTANDRKIIMIMYKIYCFNTNDNINHAIQYEHQLWLLLSLLRCCAAMNNGNYSENLPLSISIIYWVSRLLYVRERASLVKRRECVMAFSSCQVQMHYYLSQRYSILQTITVLSINWIHVRSIRSAIAFHDHTFAFAFTYRAQCTDSSIHLDADYSLYIYFGAVFFVSYKNNKWILQTIVLLTACQ